MFLTLITVFFSLFPTLLSRMRITDDVSVTVWDRWEVRGRQDWTLQDFIEAVLTSYGVKVRDMPGKGRQDFKEAVLTSYRVKVRDMPGKGRQD